MHKHAHKSSYQSLHPTYRDIHTDVVLSLTSAAAATALVAWPGCTGLTPMMWLSAPLVTVSWLVGWLEHISNWDVSAWQSHRSVCVCVCVLTPWKCSPHQSKSSELLYFWVKRKHFEKEEAQLKAPTCPYKRKNSRFVYKVPMRGHLPTMWPH